MRQKTAWATASSGFGNKKRIWTKPATTTVAIVAAVVLAGCSSPTPEPASTPTPEASSVLVLDVGNTCAELKALSVNEQAKAIKAIAETRDAFSNGPGPVIQYCTTNPDATLDSAIFGNHFDIDAATAAPAPSELLRVPISNSDGFQAVVVVTGWAEVSAPDTSACPALEYQSMYITHAVEISGTIEYPSVNGLTWAGPIELIGGAVGAATMSQPNEPVIAATCATPVSSPNSASVAPGIQDSAWIMPPDDEFAITIVYGSKQTPNNPAGQFAEAGPQTQFLGFPNVIADCAAMNTNGFTAVDVGHCQVTRNTLLS